VTRPRVLFLSHSHVFGDFRVGSHHYAREFARLDADVIHLSTPVSLVHRATGRVSRGTLEAIPSHPFRDDEGVLHVIPRTLLPRPWGPFRVRRALERLGIDACFDAVLIDQPLLWDGSVRGLADTLIYRPTDLYPSGLKRRLQDRVLASADAVVATSGTVLRDLGRLTIPSLVLENGVDLAAFPAPDADAAARPAVCVYVGALDGRFDGDRVETWALGNPDVRFVIVGPGDSLDPWPPNVEQRGQLPYADLPALLREARVGLLPLSDDPSNAGRSPMKLHEYLASGLAVVSRKTPGIPGDPVSGVYTYESMNEGDAALAQALRHPSPNIGGRHVAENHSWLAKTTELAAFVSGVTPV